MRKVGRDIARMTPAQKAEVRWYLEKAFPTKLKRVN